jgi:hypothetical protein
VRVTI